MRETFQLHVHRPRTLANALRAYRLLVDGKEVATIESGGTVTLEIPRGSRELVAKVDWVRSRPLDLSELAAVPGQTVDCLTSLHPLETFKAAFGLRSEHIVFAPHDPARSTRDDTRKLAVRMREAGVWVAGCALAGLTLVMIVDNLDPSPTVAAQLTQAILGLAGVACVVGTWSLLRK